MRGDLARATVCAPAQSPHEPERRPIRAIEAPPRARRREGLDRNRRQVARRLLLRRPPAPHADASSLVAEQRLAEAQSLVRTRAVAGPAGRRGPDPRPGLAR